MKLGRKKDWQDYVFNRLVIVILIIIALLLTTSVYKRYVIERDMSDRRTETEAAYADLLDRKDQLEAKVRYLSGERGIEEEVRKNFDVAKDGEQVVVLLGEAEPIAPVIETEPEPTPWYLFWR